MTSSVKTLILATLSCSLLVSGFRRCHRPKVSLFSADEAHKGTGDYAYPQVIRYLMAKNPYHRVLALTATPGNKPDAVQAIIDGLHISRIEIRDESSMDLKPYMFEKVKRPYLNSFIKLILFKHTGAKIACYSHARRRGEA